MQTTPAQTLQGATSPAQLHASKFWKNSMGNFAGAVTHTLWNQVRVWVQTTAKNCAWGFSLTLDWIGKRTLPYILTVELPNGVNMFFHPRLYNNWCSFRRKIGFISRENFFQKGLNTYTIDLPSYLHLIVTNTMYCVIVVIQRLLPEKSRTGKFFLDFVIPIIMDLM